MTSLPSVLSCITDHQALLISVAQRASLKEDFGEMPPTLSAVAMRLLVIICDEPVCALARPFSYVSGSRLQWGWKTEDGRQFRSVDSQTAQRINVPEWSLLS